jgi:exosortase A-associated hydrolase 2
MSVAPHAFFMPAAAGQTGQRLYLHHAPQGVEPRGALVYVHPFAEEMNKSRRMAALQSRALAQAGYAVLQIDLLGCGDSSGDFGDAAWADWVADVVQAANWLRQRHPKQALWLWGLRAGCLLAAEAVRQTDSPCNLLFWQPAPAGKVLLQQFLRLKAAGDMLDGKGNGATSELRARLAAGEPVEVAGYWLNPALASGLERATLAPPPAVSITSARRAIWLELSTRDGATSLPATTAAAEHWRGAGHEVTTALVVGPAFWQTSELEEAPALIEATLAAVGEIADT